MSTGGCPDVYERTSRDCTRCGTCTRTCASLTRANMTLGDVAAGMAAALEGAGARGAVARVRIKATPGLVQAVRGCFFCEECVSQCPADIRVSELIAKSREVFQQVGLIERAAWSSVLVDEEWHIFSAYRAIYGIGYADLTRHLGTQGQAPVTNCAVAFFPGCSLAAYAPELTREVFSYLEETFGTCTLIDQCCGSPLKSAGFTERYEALVQRIVDEIVASGARRLVVACPGCGNIIAPVLHERDAGIEVVTVARCLRECGGPAVRAEGPLRVFKSCQDRDAGYMADTLALLPEADVVGTICGGCCGAGGAVSAFSPEQQAARVADVLGRCEAGETLVTMCPTCTYTQAFQLMNEQRDDISCKNYLELVFENGFDWPTVFSQLTSMWSGEYGPWLASVFS